MTIHEMSALAGVSVRTLHHYDAIGLLPPTERTETGYRRYDETALARLQVILLFRELAFPLRDIERILDDPGFDRAAALADQIRLLELRREQLDRLIALARETLETGAIPMRFDAFDKTELDQYADEVKAKWGGTAAYQEHEARTQAGTAGDPVELMAHFAALGGLRQLAPDDPKVQNVVRALQQTITDHSYPCTKEILAGLGELYVADERFRRNIDKVGGVGTAAFAAEAIRAYCGK